MGMDDTDYCQRKKRKLDNEPAKTQVVNNIVVNNKGGRGGGKWCNNNATEQMAAENRFKIKCRRQTQNCIFYKPEDEAVIKKNMTEDIEQFLRRIFSPVASPEVVELIVSRKNDYLTNVFTTVAFNNRENYELLEAAGDAYAGAVLISYLMKRMKPYLLIKIGENATPLEQRYHADSVERLAEYKKAYASGEFFAHIANEMGIGTFIRRAEIDKKPTVLLEDVFEAFFGFTQTLLDDYFDEPGLGMNIMYKAVKPFFDAKEIPVDFETLKDSITRLKELIDYVNSSKNKGKFPPVGNVAKYDDNEYTKTTTLTLTVNYQPLVVIETPGTVKKERQKRAANQMLELLRQLGISKN